MEFQSKWVENCVRKVLNKTEGTLKKEDLSKIKYAKAGGDFSGSLVIELSLITPPIPFVAFDGGDEWAVCLHSESTLGEQYQLEDLIRFEHGFWLDHFQMEEWKYAYSKEAKKAWKTFEPSIVKQNLFADYSEDEPEKIDAAYQFLIKDLAQLSFLHVLRLYEIELDNPTWFQSFPELQVLELAEVSMQEEGNGIQAIANLKEVSIWCD